MPQRRGLPKGRAGTVTAYGSATVRAPQRRGLPKGRAGITDREYTLAQLRPQRRGLPKGRAGQAGAPEGEGRSMSLNEGAFRKEEPVLGHSQVSTTADWPQRRGLPKGRAGTG